MKTVLSSGFYESVVVVSIEQGKHASTAKEHLDKVVDFFSKIDPILGDLVLKSKPSENDISSNDATVTHSGKRKWSDAEESSHNGHAKKKANTGSNGSSLTLSQREKRGMENLATYLEERGGGFHYGLILFIGMTFHNVITNLPLRIILYTHRRTESSRPIPL